MTTRPAVLYVCFDVLPGPKGASTHISYFVQALTATCDVTVISPGAPDETSPGTFRGARHLTVPLPQPNLLDRVTAFREAVWDELEAGAYDLVHFRTMWVALPVAEEKRRRGYQVVCEVNAVESIELKYHYPALRANPSLLAKLRAQEQLAFTAADALVTPSAVTRRYLVGRGVPEERVTVIPNGVDLELFQPASEPVPLGEPLDVLYVGTLAPWQGLDFLLQAIRRVAEVRPVHLRLLAGGSSRWRRDLERTASKLGLEGQISFVPPVPHEGVPAIIQGAGVCVAPLAPTERNLVQGCHPLKVLEYMACAKPIVAADLPVVRDILTADHDALLYKVTKPRRLTDCLLRLAEDPVLAAQLGHNALQTARERFSWATAQEALRAVYAGLLPSSDA